MQLIALREKTGKSLAEVAADLGTTASTVNRHERGITPLSSFHRAAYGLYYKVKPETIEQPDRDEAAA